VLAIADKGWKRALADDAHLRNGLNVAFGRITYRAVAEALELRQRYASPESVIAAH
jgi:alanine dehydrogenase